jgi:hypothetical protein
MYFPQKRKKNACPNKAGVLVRTIEKDVLNSLRHNLRLTLHDDDQPAGGSYSGRSLEVRSWDVVNVLVSLLSCFSFRDFFHVFEGRTLERKLSNI